MKRLITRVLLVIISLTPMLSGNVFAAKAKPDITTDFLILNKTKLSNGNTKTIKASAASFHANGKCMFDASYKTINSGKGDVSENFVNILKRDGKLVRRNKVNNLKAQAKNEHKFLLSLNAGDNALELTLDDSNKIAESNEKNNKLSAKLKIVGKCSGKSRQSDNKAPVKKK